MMLRCGLRSTESVNTVKLAQPARLTSIRGSGGVSTRRTLVDDLHVHFDDRRSL